MTRTVADRIAAVRRLVAAAGGVARRPGLVEALVETTRLSRRGVELALREHLETDPGDEDVTRLVERAGDAAHVHVVLSANVFVGALRALAVARAASDEVTVSPSRRDPVFARALVEEADDRCLSVREALPIETLRRGEVHVYGRDETVADISRRARHGVLVRGHRAGVGAVIVTRTRGLREAARAIARDVVPFDQRGCLSPRIVVVLDRTAAFELGVELDRALRAIGDQVPRGAISDEESAEAARYVSTMAFAGRLWTGPTHAVGLAVENAPLVLPPPGRHLHVAVAHDLDATRALLAPIAPFVAAIGADAQIPRDLLGHAVRVSALGFMQRPPLDGPVDVRA